MGQALTPKCGRQTARVVIDLISRTRIVPGGQKAGRLPEGFRLGTYLTE
jgi:hypothetical protein